MTEELRDTGKHPKIPDEAEHMSNARVFDTLVTSNLQLVKAIRSAMLIIVGCGIVATGMAGASAYMLRMGQIETRELLRELRGDCAQKGRM